MASPLRVGMLEAAGGPHGFPAVGALPACGEAVTGSRTVDARRRHAWQQSYTAGPRRTSCDATALQRPDDGSNAAGHQGGRMGLRVGAINCESWNFIRRLIGRLIEWRFFLRQKSIIRNIFHPRRVNRFIEYSDAVTESTPGN
ncbi:hypothetical protein [Frateuria sp. Soil773]|uniref:hypothetical protein n=1 Tax=Frateuria sp. Soil773 TaxID=1736407 RepID=UPI0012F88AB9|nr:hypothetical protein [Frateuria sp. Soil773]